MPNWCSNTVTVYHEQAHMIDRFVNAAHSDGLFESYVSIGPDDAPTAKWGCKWDVNMNDDGSFIERVDDNTVSMSFMTPWSPPIEFYEALENDNGYEVNAYFYEPGVGFAGTFDNGSTNEYEVSNQADVEALPEDLRVEMDIDSYFEEAL